MIRDIRDCICSWMNWVMDLKSHNHIPGLYFYLHALQNDEERLLTIIEGKDRFLPSYRYHLEYGWGWINSKNTLIIRYEDIIGPQGGGDHEKQKEAIRKILTHLDIDFSEKEIEFLSNNLWGGATRTMKFGKSRYWENRFTHRVNVSFKKYYHDYMKILGY